MTSKYLNIARDFIQHGVPVFVAPPSREPTHAEFKYPRSWQTYQPNLHELAWFERHWCISAVTGFGFDVIDVDPRNGGKESLEALVHSDLLPEPRWIVNTPGGGVHLYINRTLLRSLGAGKLLPGIDFKAGDLSGRGRGFVYLPGTERAKYDYKGYEPEGEINWTALEQPDDSEQFKRFSELVLERQGLVSLGKVRGDGNYHGPELTAKKVDHLVNVVQDAINRLASTQEGERNDALNRVGYFLGGLASGSGLPIDKVYGVVHQTAVNIGLSESEIDYHLDRAIAQGRLRPVDIFEGSEV